MSDLRIIDNRDKKDEEDNIVPFQRPELRVVPGMKEPPGTDWLSRLTPGTIFLTRPNAKMRAKMNMNPAILEEFMMFALTPAGNVELANRQGQHQMWVDPKGFCLNMDLVETLPPED